MKKNKVLIGTRGSSLALAQAGTIVSSLKKLYPKLNFDIKIIKTKGDKIQKGPLSRLNSTGFFVKEIEDALLNKKIDIGIHSLKDLPTKSPKGLVISAFTKRELPNDVLITKNKIKGNALKNLAKGSIIGTGSARRKAFLLNLRPDLKTVDLRGNIDTRLKKLKEENIDAIILAYAGIKRLKINAKNKYIVPLDVMVPCPGQGILGIQTRANDRFTKNLVAPLNNIESFYMAKAELTALKIIGGGCSVPIGINAQIKNNTIEILGSVLGYDGEIIITASHKGKLSDAGLLGKRVAQDLIKLGARNILNPHPNPPAKAGQASPLTRRRDSKQNISPLVKGEIKRGL